MNNELAEWIVKAIETIKSGVVDELVKYLEDLKSKAEATKELREENELLKNSDSLCKLIGEQKLKITDLENKLANADYQLEGRDLEIKELEAQIEKMKNQKVFLLQRVDTDDHTIDKWLYTTDEDIAKEWNDYYKPNYCYGQAIELKEFSDKERIREELENG